MEKTEDYSKLKKLKRKLREIKKVAKKGKNELLKFQSAIEQSPTSVIITDIDGKIEYVNKKFTESTGYTKEEVVGENPRVLKSGHQPDEYYKELWETISSGENWYGVFYNQRKDHSFYWELANIAPVKNISGKITNYIAIKEDLTEKKNLEHDLIVAKEKAEKADKLKSAFLANVSHEIRTPLNAIIGFSDIISREISEKERKLYTEIIKNSSLDLLNIVTSILDIAKIESGYAALHKENFSINNLMTELYEYFNLKKDKIGKNHLSIYYTQNLIEERAIIHTDRDRLKQILLNLLENALKFTSEGKIEFGCHLVKNGNEIEIFVHDTGIGILKEKQDYIFERFTQIDESTTRLYSGTGLGLSISRGLAQLLDANLRLESEEGNGTTFYLSLPYQPVKKSGITKSKEKINYKIHSNKEILVVEDEYSNFELVREFLSHYNLKLFHASTGLEAIELFKMHQKTINLVLMDIRLPDINGYDTTRIIKSINADVPVIALTAFAIKTDKESAFKAGCVAYITKPINENIFLNTIEKYI